MIESSTSAGVDLYVLTARDSDEPGINTAVTFRLDDVSLPFAVDSSTGVISVRDSLTPQRYELVVVVTDGGDPMLSSNYTLFVQVVPPNNYDPRFLGPFNTTFPENSPSVQFTITVEDLDVGLEGTVNLTLLDTEFFDFEFRYVATDTEGTFTLIQPVDYEQYASFRLTVEATDLGNPFFRRTSNQSYDFIVTDVNDNAPQFINTPYTVSVGENAQSGYVFFQVEATDADRDLNAAIEFSLGADFSGLFAIDGSSGNVSVVGDLNLLVSNRSFYELTIFATDENGAGLSSNTTLGVTVLDDNNNAPIFDPEPPTNITILDDSPAGFSLLNISVTDADTGIIGIVDLSLQQTGQLFRLEGNELTLNEIADLEVKNLI